MTIVHNGCLTHHIIPLVPVSSFIHNPTSTPLPLLFLITDSCSFLLKKRIPPPPLQIKTKNKQKNPKNLKFRGRGFYFTSEIYRESFSPL